MSEQVLQVLPWVGLALLLVLCLPIPAVQKLVLELTACALRLALLAVLAGAAYLWFRPAELPAEVVNAVNGSPRLVAILPDPLTPNFGLCAAAIVVGALVPVLAVLDVTRKLAGRRLGRIRALTAVAPAAAPAPAAVVAPAPVAPTPPPRPVDRRSAAAAIASAGSRPHAPAPDRPRS